MALESDRGSRRRGMITACRGARRMVTIRRLLILGGTSLVRYARGAGGSIWAKRLLARRPTRIVTFALANKPARIIWALLTRGEVYRAPQPQTA